MIEFRAVQDGERMDDSPLMSSVLRVCRKCGAEVLSDAPEGLCTACLFETGLNLFTEEVQTSNAQCPTSNVECRDEGRAPRSARVITDFGDYELLKVIGRGG